MNNNVIRDTNNLFDISNVDTVVLENITSENMSLIESKLIKINNVKNLVMKNIVFRNSTIDIDTQQFFETQAIQNGHLSFIEFINIHRIG